ncbi:pyrroline-5-carboxylate reductase [Thermohalobacter berrensis]|uniref:Pyrroline-5-carboxylate reductase n=1 Tax=Thermohalobacter berrensis TaxID=99594 RepID=A0A419SWJ8_9FIRM|nr:pyrroline-5-carboxylate reductase [Thermohalobacter berrensis]RKD29571.1 pyrroline-5-carboxylate reductase [Thermohalobacter berrensis]
MYKIGLIGAGNMGFAIMKGLLKEYLYSHIVFTDKSREKKERIKEKLKIKYINDNKELAQKSKFIVLAVKPQNYDQVISEIDSVLNEKNIIVSIAPGITIQYIKERLRKDIKVVRAMPNTPALVGEGMTAISFSNDEFEEEEIKDVKKIFKSLGETVIIDEKYQDAIVPISGSSPAYVYMFIEAMADAGVLMGLPRELSYKLASQTVLGAAKMVLETGKHPGELKDNVCSPGGTTIEAVANLEKNGFRGVIIEGMNKCYEKTKKMKN